VEAFTTTTAKEAARLRIAIAATDIRSKHGSQAVKSHSCSESSSNISDEKIVRVPADKFQVVNWLEDS